MRRYRAEDGACLLAPQRPGDQDQADRPCPWLPRREHRRHQPGRRQRQPQDVRPVAGCGPPAPRTASRLRLHARPARDRWPYPGRRTAETDRIARCQHHRRRFCRTCLGLGRRTGATYWLPAAPAPDLRSTQHPAGL
uniref:Uncharacterized protein n=1 Tax=Parastrongyloides trichosuri TaxID=131310 RepID=A0A0N4ZL10_PARTI